MDKFFSPKSIAIIGASTKKGTLSWDLVHNIMEFGYTGRLYPVNSKAESVHSIKSYKSVSEINDEIDLAIIMVQKELVFNIIDECGKKNIKAVIVITAGFKEAGDEGALMENSLKKQTKKYNIRLVGPNCMGIINTDPSVRLNGTFIEGEPMAGGIGFVSQSGALGAAVLKTVHQNDIGLAQFVSIGNKADVSGNVVIDYWRNKPAIKVITVYLESFGNPRGFMELTREITKNKPVIVIKSARTKAGVRAASSHTGALATSDAVVDAFLSQAGVIRVDNIEEMFDIARGFDRANLPKGNRVAILTNAGGPAILAADVLAYSGLVIPELSRRTQNKLRKIAPPEGAVSNPVDLLPPATGEMYEQAVKIILKDENVDSLITILGPPLIPDTLGIAKSICEGMRNSEKTNMLVLMSQDIIIPRLAEALPDHPPVYRFPEAAAKSIGEMYKFTAWKNLPAGKSLKFKIDNKAVQKVSARLKKSSGTYLPFNEVCAILKAYGLPVIETVYAENKDELYEQSKSINYPVVLKASGKKLIHKSDAGGVITGIYSEDMLLSSAERIIKNLKRFNKDKLLERFIIQPFITGGVETIIGVSKDEKAGHLIMFGLGGIYVEILNDVVFRLLPITDREAWSMIRSVKSYKILKGIRGNKPADIEFIKECMLRISQLISDFPEISEIDLNPFIFSSSRSDCKILDARIRI